MSRITGAEVRKGSAHPCQDRAGWCQGCWDNRLAAQLDADASLATRLAEAEREVDSLLRAMAPPEMVWLPDVAGRVTQINNLVAGLRAELARLRREVAEWQHTANEHHGCATALEADLARLREKLAEAERGLDVCDCCAGSGVPVSGPGCICGGKGTALAERQGLRAELARLRPLAAEAGAWEKVKAHPMRAKDSFIVHDQDDGWSVSPLSGPRLSAPTAVALLERLDALVPKPEPGVWRWRFALDGNTSRQTFVSAERALRWGRNQPHDGAPVRETVSPDGVVTLTPAPEGT